MEENEIGFTDTEENQGWIEAFLSALATQSKDYLFIIMPHSNKEAIVLRSTVKAMPSTPIQAYDKAMKLKAKAGSSSGLVVSEVAAQKQQELDAALDFYCNSTGKGYTYIAVPILAGEVRFARNGKASLLNGMDVPDIIDDTLGKRYPNVIYCSGHNGDIGGDEAEFQPGEKEGEFKIKCKVCKHEWTAGGRHFRKRGDPLPNPFVPLHVPLG